MYLLFYIILLSSVSLAAGAAFMGDIFFFISLRNRRLQIQEIKTLQRMSGISMLSSVVALFSEIVLTVIMISTSLSLGDEESYIIMLILLITFTCSLTMRNIHLPALKRHHHDHAHLSDKFIEYHDSLVATAAVSTFSWFFIIFLISLRNQGVIVSSDFNLGFASLAVIYIVFAFIASKCGILLKRIFSKK